MRIFVPFTKLRSETLVSVPDAILVPLIDKEYDYSRYFKKRWNEKQTFINVEHDVVPTREILLEIWNCSEPLCIAGYCSSIDIARGISHIGCAKISESLIKQFPNLFDIPCEWIECEGRITEVTNAKFCYHGEVYHLKTI